MTKKQEALEEAAARGHYREYARLSGFKYLDVYDWTNSSGEGWTFIVSKNRKKWHVMYQSREYLGYHYTIEDRAWFGTAEEVLEQIWEECVEKEKEWHRHCIRSL